MAYRKQEQSPIWDNAPITRVQAAYLTEVYGYLAAAVLAAVLAGYNGFPLVGSYVGMIVSVLSFLYINATRPWDTTLGMRNSITRPTALAIMAGSMGGAYQPLVQYLGDSPIIGQAAVATVAVFGGLSLASVMDFRNRTFLYLGSILAAGAMWSLLLMVGGRLTGFSALISMQSLLSFIMALGYTLYDTQVVLEAAARGERDAVGHAAMFFLDAIRIFQEFLRRLQDREDDERRK